MDKTDTAGLTKLARRGLSFLRLDDEEWAELEGTRLSGSRFSLIFPHQVARSGKKDALALISVEGKNPSLRLGLVRSIQAVSTLDSRVVFDPVYPIAPGSLATLTLRVMEVSLQKSVRILLDDGSKFRSIPQKLGERFVELIAAEPDNKSLLHRIAVSADRPKRFDSARGLQADAVKLALKAFGANDGASSLTIAGDSAIATARLQEDAVIEHDARWIPGWSLSQSDLTGRATFSRGNETLEVFTANKRPLEELFGVDLIYLNIARGALVMVQYKMLEPQGGESDEEEDASNIGGVGVREEAKEHEWIVRLDQQFKDELSRMKLFDRDLSSSGSYRLNSSAFFFKLVRRYASTESAGILLSLGHVEQMISTDQASGPRGGLRISYKELGGHYLRGEVFVELIRSGYIGTRDATTDHLQALIDKTLSGGRAVVAAIQRALHVENPIDEVSL